MTTVAGIDGCRDGWLCVTKNLSSGACQARILKSIEELRSLEPRPYVIAVDIPIGLTESGSRACDVEARARLKAPRSSSVFPAPIRPVLRARTYAEACSIGQSIDGRKLSRQAWAIVPKIFEVDAFLRREAAGQTWVREVHPEVCFWAWNGGRAMIHRKKSVAGRLEREAIVQSRYEAAHAVARTTLRRGTYAHDDLLDAFAALWSAERLAAGNALMLPQARRVDTFGLRMEIAV